MGFWSTIGSLAGLGLAPFTGGASLIPSLAMGAGIGGAIGGGVDALTGSNGPPGSPSVAGGVGQTAAAMERARLEALIAQTNAQQRQDEERLAMAKFGLEAPRSLARNAAQGDILANAQDATISGLPSYIHVPTIGGGLRPSLFSAATRALGAKMPQDALAASKAGTYNLSPTPLPSASAYDKILSGLATGGGFLNALSGLGGNRQNPGGIYGGTAADVEGGVNPEQDLAQAGMSNPLPGGTGIPPLDTGNADQNQGIDPAILAWWQQQAVSPPQLAPGGGS